MPDKILTSYHRTKESTNRTWDLILYKRKTIGADGLCEEICIFKRLFYLQESKNIKGMLELIEGTN